ncbi:acetyltransferase [Erythrobacter arachoides]|uniref:Acetyltransferase n=1 Tax=Aurantiacibacter arachoides TaxID=1850444 RepID=A0A845A0J9_9SPHN|nr:CatB-related O-acetyltransferase [Aurantiacibacter arachoides]MXO93244.1 acetyltransferase [Aurantiacibacter arachoides]
MSLARLIWSSLKRRTFVSGPVRVGSRFHIGLLSFVSASTDLEIGSDVYIGKFCSVQCNGRIGSGTLIANNVGIVGRRDHRFKTVGSYVRRAPWVGDDHDLASHPKNSIEIGVDVWIGFGATILSGICIGRGAIIAAGSVVTEDVEPYSIISGNPARVVGKRFNVAQIEEHERLLKGLP